MNSDNLIIDYFPISVATGQAFCNREEEITRLKTYVELKRPTLISSPRRYGKTSLVLRTIEQTQLPFIFIDLFSVVDEQDIEKAILRGVGQFIQSLESKPMRALALARKIFEDIHFRVFLGEIGISIEIHSRKDKPAYHILEILKRLEFLVEKTDNQLILFFDEFQSIGEATSNHAIEGVLRQVVQLSHSISFIFSGSNRHLLNRLFDDRNRPFYKLCERILLDRISEEAYLKHIQNAANGKWQKDLSQEILDSIFYYSERHPYYLNQLCSRIFIGSQTPTVELVRQIWRRYLIEERSNVAAEITLLSKNQRKLLTILSRIGSIDAPLGQKFIQLSGIPKTTVEQSLTVLEKNDYVFKDQHGVFHVLDPLIKGVLAENIENHIGLQ